MKRAALLVGALALIAGRAGAQEVDRGISLYKAGKYAQAEPILQASATPEGRAWLAATLVRLNRPAQAEAKANAALKDQPTNAVAVAALGEALVVQNKLDPAIARMTAALAAKEKLAYAYYWRGQAYQRKKEIARMVDDYQAFLKLEPDAPEAPALKVLLRSLS